MTGAHRRALVGGCASKACEAHNRPATEVAGLIYEVRPRGLLFSILAGRCGRVQGPRKTLTNTVS